MRKRLLLAAAASALAVSFVPQGASAQHTVQCAPGFELICVVHNAAMRPLCKLHIHC